MQWQEWANLCGRKVWTLLWFKIKTITCLRWGLNPGALGAADLKADPLTTRAQRQTPFARGARSGVDELLQLLLVLVHMAQSTQKPPLFFWRRTTSPFCQMSRRLMTALPPPQLPLRQLLSLQCRLCRPSSLARLHGGTVPPCAAVRTGMVGVPPAPPASGRRCCRAMGAWGRTSHQP